MKALYLVALLALACSCANLHRQGGAGAVVSIEDSEIETNRATLSVSGVAPFFQMQIEEDREMERRPGNFGCYKLVLLNREGKEVASESFSAHYGIHVDAVDLDGDSIPEFVVQAQIGPATGPPIKELIILRYRPLDAARGFLETVLKTPCAGQANSGVGWEYELQYVGSRESRAMDLRLALEHGHLTHGWELLPADKIKLISFRNRRLLVLIPTAGDSNPSNKNAR